ncbi:LacI family DNA-binding transcriptional regulator [Enterocloster bolteae]|uniref:LacI family DNA-binding transcriptional regulator n=1 Tax=Enterocloster bolteae TaxID=208479 RepID=UPI0029006E18|nr:LacI family DNA-binding transcriptional regulator [Enterocloster bolteae]MDU1139602.1 LacI family DNA-binding transcriptional regulator [Enterocloster bolteae]
MATKPTISQIADMSGVSIATVSRFINNTTAVKGSTAKKIMEVQKRTARSY